ncbi:MAG: hypothetical protein JNJ83_23540 [Verrucomicrobiaceae bacterium]|nr:hypothetical protein [Verrucomicrobiaceae bacterium]
MTTFSFCTWPTQRASLALLLTTATILLSSCDPTNPEGRPLNPGTAHNIKEAEVTAYNAATFASSQATWKDADGTGAGLPDTSQCKLTLTKNTTFSVYISRATLKNHLTYTYDSSSGEVSADYGFDFSDDFVAVIARNQLNFAVYLSDPDGLLSSAICADDGFLNMAKGFPEAAGIFPLRAGPNQIPKSGLGRNMTWTTGSTPKTGTITLTIVRRPDKSKGVNYNEAMPSLPSPLSGIVDLSIPLTVTIQ